ncbi:MAG: DUF493 domain-containing protein [Victivallaceae bacterium]|nr:DUF493 domain-containing protein [Victivallaceae bacterium]
MAEKMPKLEFPADWNYRLIIDPAKAGCYERILEILKAHGIAAVPKPKRNSSGGKYQSYRIPVVFTSREMMAALSSELAAVDGVKFLL